MMLSSRGVYSCIQLDIITHPNYFQLDFLPSPNFFPFPFPFYFLFFFPFLSLLPSPLLIFILILLLFFSFFPSPLFYQVLPQNSTLFFNLGHTFYGGNVRLYTPVQFMTYLFFCDNIKLLECEGVFRVVDFSDEVEDLPGVEGICDVIVVIGVCGKH